MNKLLTYFCILASAASLAVTKPAKAESMRDKISIGPGVDVAINKKVICPLYGKIALNAKADQLSLSAGLLGTIDDWESYNVQVSGVSADAGYSPRFLSTKHEEGENYRLGMGLEGIVVHAKFDDYPTQYTQDASLMIPYLSLQVEYGALVHKLRVGYSKVIKGDIKERGNIKPDISNHPFVAISTIIYIPLSGK